MSTVSTVYINIPGEGPKTYFTNSGDPVPATLEDFPAGSYYSEIEYVGTVAEKGPDTIYHGASSATINYGYSYEEHMGKMHKAQISYTYYSMEAKKALQVKAHKLLGGVEYVLPSTEDEFMEGMMALLHGNSRGSKCDGALLVAEMKENVLGGLLESFLRMETDAHFGNRAETIQKMVDLIEAHLEVSTKFTDELRSEYSRFEPIPTGTIVEFGTFLKSAGWQPPAKEDPELDEAIADLKDQPATGDATGDLAEGTDKGSDSVPFGPHLTPELIAKPPVIDGLAESFGPEVLGAVSQEGTAHQGQTAQITQEDADRLFGPGTERAFTGCSNPIVPVVPVDIDESDLRAGDYRDWDESERDHFRNQLLADYTFGPTMVNSLGGVGIKTLGELLDLDIDRVIGIIEARGCDEEFAENEVDRIRAFFKSYGIDWGTGANLTPTKDLTRPGTLLPGGLVAGDALKKQTAAQGMVDDITGVFGGNPTPGIGG
jgi:hypothetical protein